MSENKEEREESEEREERKERKFPHYKVDYLPVDMILPGTPKSFFDHIVINGFSVICFSTTIILTAVICAAAFFRYVLNGDLTGYEEWVKIFAFWLYFSGQPSVVIIVPTFLQISFRHMFLMGN